MAPLTCRLCGRPHAVDHSGLCEPCRENRATPRTLRAARAGLGFLDRRVRDLHVELAAERAAHQRTRAQRDELRRRIRDLDPYGQTTAGGAW